MSRTAPRFSVGRFVVLLLASQGNFIVHIHLNPLGILTLVEKALKNYPFRDTKLSQAYGIP